MIQIDDAGSGSLIGGTGIGILNTDTNEYYFDIIPLKYYQTELFQEKKYQDYVIKIIETGFEKLKVSKKHNIELCQGYMFDQLRDWLTANKYNWESTKIDGPLQFKVEESFNEYVFDLGLPKNFIKHARFAFGFHRLLKWVFADLENRKKLCKTQWKSWQKWSNVEKSIYANRLTYTDYCLKCGEKIVPPLDVITMEYQTYKPATINIHKNCFTGDLREKPPSFLKEFSLNVKVPNKSLSGFHLENNAELLIQEIDNQLNLVNQKKVLISTLPSDISAKLLFWLKKGFKYRFYLRDYSKTQANISVILQS